MNSRVGSGAGSIGTQREIARTIEDRSRVRRDNSALNLAALRRVALALLKKDTSRKVGIATKRRRAWWDRDSLTRVLLGS